jgi:hypothetical protein
MKTFDKIGTVAGIDTVSRYSGLKQKGGINENAWIDSVHGRLISSCFPLSLVLMLKKMSDSVSAVVIYNKLCFFRQMLAIRVSMAMVYGFVYSSRIYRYSE